MGCKLLIEAPVNGGRNYQHRGSCKIRLYAGISVLRKVKNPVLDAPDLGLEVSDNASGADNQQERPSA